jgi:hypothetical protein
MASDQPFQPSLGDVLVVRSMLAQAVILPELVGTILDYAEYWVRSCSKAQLDESIHAIWSSDGYYQGSKFLVNITPRELKLMRLTTMDLRSYDHSPWG